MQKEKKKRKGELRKKFLYDEIYNNSEIYYLHYEI